MSFIIDQKLCSGCGSCIGNCPNRAIVRREDKVVVTQMCCDCGICIKYCGMEAIGEGKNKTDFDNSNLNSALKDKLSLTGDIVAMKFADEVPDDVSANDDMNFWCHICGDIFEGEGGPIFFTGKNSMCGGGNAIGLGSRKVKKEEFNMVMDGMLIGEGCYYASKDLLTKPRPLFPKFPKVYKGMVIGSLQNIKMPDIILFPINGHQLCVLTTAFSFDTGEIIMGNAGPGACMSTVIIPFMENKPVFSCGDHGGRSHMRLKDEELIACIPYKLVPGIVRNLDRTAYAKKE